MMVSVKRGRLVGALCLFSILLLGADRASATSLIAFGDTDPANDSTRFGLRDQLAAKAVTWTQSVGASNVTIEAWVARPNSEVPGTEVGEAYLTNAIGLGTTAASVVAQVSFTTPLVGSPTDLNVVAPVTLFTGLTLSPGTYYLVLGGPNHVLFVDPFDWLGQPNPTAAIASGFSVGPAFAAFSVSPALDVFEPNNAFVLISATDFGQPFFRLTGDVVQDASVPEPATLLLVGGGIAAAIRARKRSTADRR
jgi:hypothetical protein